MVITGDTCRTAPPGPRANLLAARPGVPDNLDM